MLAQVTPIWSHPSVTRMAEGGDPLEAITSKAREMVLGAVQAGWEGPPFDPFRLAEILGIVAVPKEDVLDARIVSGGQRPEIQYNPNRPRTRVRFSLAHEIAHTLFPDYHQSIRNRGSVARSDDWELELLCNLAASELLMPTGYAVNPDTPPSVDMLIELQETCAVSLEAAAIRVAHSTRYPCNVAVASKRDPGGEGQSYRVDYSLASRTSPLQLDPGITLEGSVFSQCTAVGFTAKGREPSRSGARSLYWECVGIPPYPGRSYPRVLGICKLPAGSRTELGTELVEVRGDALKPRGPGPKVVAQVVNDKTPNWGGGFSKAARERFPAAQADFRRWAAESRANLSLGSTHVTAVGEDTHLASMVAQHGYGASDVPRIRYIALRKCLGLLRDAAVRLNATVHMPRVGAGLAGGNWSVISELIDEQLVRRGVSVTVYSLPGRAAPSPGDRPAKQSALSEEWSSG